MDCLPQFFPKSWIAEYQVFGMEFTEDVSIGFVRKEEGGYSYMLQDKFSSSSYSENKLLEEGLENLYNLNQNLEVKLAKPKGAVVVWITAEDNFTAVRLILPKVQKFLRDNIGENFYFTIPSRDLMLCWNADAPNEVTSKHFREAIEDFKAEKYNLSPSVFQYSENWACNRIR